MGQHIKHPIRALSRYGYIGEPPLSDKLAMPLARLFQYLNNWAMNYQIFSFSNCSYDEVEEQGDGWYTWTEITQEKEDGVFFVIVHSPPAASAEDRLLQGVLVPWHYRPHIDSVSGDYDSRPLIEWGKSPSFSSLWESHATYGWDRFSQADSQLPTGGEILLGGTDFKYTPVASGGWDVYRLITRNIRTAALGIWPAPFYTLDDDQAQILLTRVAKGEVIRGYTGSTDKESLGDLIHLVGDGTMDDDVLSNMSMRCLFQWGHPIGVWSSDSSYVDLGVLSTESGHATYKVQPPQWSPTYHSSTCKAYPALVVSTSGAAVGNEAHVRLTAVGTSDTWDLAIDSDLSQNLFDYTDASNDTLSINTTGDEFYVEVKAPSSGEITLHTVSLWCHPWL